MHALNALGHGMTTVLATVVLPGGNHALKVAAATGGKTFWQVRRETLGTSANRTPSLLIKQAHPRLPGLPGLRL